MTTTKQDDWDSHWAIYDLSNKTNPAQAYRRRLLLRFLNLSEKNGRLVDIGCGTGEFIAHLQSAAPDLAKLGLEYSAKGVEIARRREPTATFLQVDLTKPTDGLQKFSRWGTQAVCSEVLEHVDDPVGVLKNASTFLAPGCRLVVTVPGGPISAYDRHIGHRRHYTAGTLEQLLRDAGFDVEFAIGAGFPFFNLYRVLVLARGTKLIADAEGEPSVLLKAVSTVFKGLMPLNVTHSVLGWQTIAVACKPAIL